MNFELDPKSIFTKLLYLITILLLANVTGIVFKFYLDHDYFYGLIPLFDFNKENNIPTLYSSFALIFVSILLSLIGSTHKRLGSSYILWFGLAIIFLFLSIDETASIHERFADPVRESLNTSGLLYYAWVIPYGAALIVFTIVYFRFLTGLPTRIRNLFLVSGALFVSGAIGFELLGGRQAELYGRENPLFVFLYTCEEFLEMLGIVIFIYALLLYIATRFQSLTISLIEQEE